MHSGSRAVDSLVRAMMNRNRRNNSLGGFRMLCLISLVAIVSLYGPSSPRAQSSKMAVPEWNQMMIFLKVLTYDRVLQDELIEAIQIGVLYRPGNGKSEENKNRIVDFLEENATKTINGRPFIYSVIPYLSADQLAVDLAQQETRILYVTLGHDDCLGDIAAQTRTRKILTITGVPDYAVSWLSVSLKLRGSSPQIVVNLTASKAEQHEFSANLLRLCEVIR